MTQKIDMLNGGLFKKIVLFTVPIMLQGLLQSIYNSADLVVVGQFSGDVALSAVGATSSIFNVLVGLFMGFSAGVDVASSHAFGKGDYKTVKRIIDTAVITAPFLGLIVTILGLTLSGPILTLMGTPTEDGVLEQATTYLQILMIGVPFTMLFNFCAAVLRTSGETNKPFIYLASSGILNVLLNLLFCGVFNLGVVGVSVATVISQVASAIMIFINLMINKGLFSFSFKSVEFSWKALGKITAVGLPSGFQSAVFSLSNVFLQTGVNSFGKDAIAGSTAVSTVEGLMWVTLTSFQNATTTFVSQNVGAGNLKRARKVVRFTLSMTAILGLVLGLSAFFAKELILAIFIKDNPIAVQYGIERLTFTFPIYFLAGIMGVLPGAIRGLGYSVSPTIISLVGVCGMRILWVYTVFPIFNNLAILYLIHPITWVLSSTALFINYFISLHLRKKKIGTPKEQSDDTITLEHTERITKV
ncbi:MAG: MATE family efflux transporter [Clostridia bacterium]|nr:MATE family efflux transporter [Clostridia bacterium]